MTYSVVGPHKGGGGAARCGVGWSSRAWLACLLVALATGAACLGLRSARPVTWSRPGEETLLRQDGDADVATESAGAISWVGCFVVGGLQDFDDVVGIRHTTTSCAKECHRYVFMGLQEHGARCVCGNSHVHRANYQEVEDGQCGPVCDHEVGMQPQRLCGAQMREAVYRLDDGAGLKRASGAAEAPAVEAAAADFVGEWLFGRDQSSSFSLSPDAASGRLHFRLPLPRGREASGELRPQGSWLRADLSSRASSVMGAVRLRPLEAGAVLASFRQPGAAVWGREVLARRAPAPGARPAVAIYAWRVLPEAGVRVRSAPEGSSAVLSSKEQDSAVRGWERDGWVGLVDEPGYIRLSDRGRLSLEQVQVDAWRVVTKHGLYVRSRKDTSSRVLGVKPPGTVVLGHREGDWVALLDQPGFLLVSSASRIFLKRTSAVTDEGAVEVVNAPQSEATAWKVATPHGLNVRAAKDLSSDVLAVKPEGAVLHGRLHGRWVALVDEPGFVLAEGGDGCRFLVPAARNVIITAPPAGTGVVTSGRTTRAAMAMTASATATATTSTVSVATTTAVNIQSQVDCLSLQKDGCHSISDKLTCLTSSDGRRALTLRGGGIHGQPCTWCGGRQCSNGPHLCEPFNEAAPRRSPDHIVAHCQADMDISVPNGTSSTTIASTATTIPAPIATLIVSSTQVVTTSTATSSRTTSTATSTSTNTTTSTAMSTVTITVTITATTATSTATVTTATRTSTRTATTLTTLTTSTTSATTTSTTTVTSTTATSTSITATTMTTTTSSRTTVTTTSTEWIPPQWTPSIYCFALMLPFGYERGLLREQLLQAIGIFICDDFTVFSNETMHIGHWNQTGPIVATSVVKGSLQCPLGGKWHTALNTEIFLRIWAAVVALGAFRRHDWTVKADPDSVFFPERLRSLLSRAPMAEVPLLQKPSSASEGCGRCARDGSPAGGGSSACDAHVRSLQRGGRNCSAALLEAMRPEPSGCACTCGATSCEEGQRFGGMYLVNCRFGLHGPIEVLSREAVQTFVDNVHRCKKIQAKPYGEDKYLDKCLELLGVRRVLQYSLLRETACGQVDPAPCDAPNVAFHPFKEIQGYFDCWGYASKFGRWP